RRGEAAVVIATEDHCKEFRKGLEGRGHDPARMMKEGRLAVLDARATLESILRQGMPDETLFRQVISPVLSTLSAGGAPNVRAYGEMVSLLWRDGGYDAALRLEELWKELGKTCNFMLLCAYEGDALAPEFHGQCAEAIFQAHSHVIPADG